MLKILIAEDDRDLRQLFSHVLIKNGYAVKGVCDGQEALDALDGDYYDLIISDIMMPRVDGYSLVRQLRESGSNIPVLMITARDAFDDMRQGFLSGTDDYMVKPIDGEELLLRISALLRRARIAHERSITVGETTLYYDSYAVRDPEGEHILPQKEFLLLFKLLSYPGKTFTRRHLMDELWGMDSDTDERTVDVHINRLRERFRSCTDFEIVTIRGLGYKVNCTAK